MGGSILALDTILSATGFFVGKWTSSLKRNQSRDLLRFLLCRLYDQSRGRLMVAEITLAQGTLARKLGLSRQWVGILLQRLQDAGWLEYHADILPDGMRSSCIFRIGRQLKRLIVMLTKAKPRKRPTKPVAKCRWQSSPTKVEKRLSLTQQKENEPPPPHLLMRIPLLGKWLERGQ
jgi:DNA-binding Lrp family transcriptional regulator